MEENKEFDQQLLKIPRKIEDIQEWMVTAGSSISSVTHKNRENKILISDLKRDVDEQNKVIEDLRKTVIEQNISISNIKSGMDKVESKFTWTKIFAVTMAIITVCAGAISTMLVILNNLGILKVISK